MLPILYIYSVYSIFYLCKLFINNEHIHIVYFNHPCSSFSSYMYMYTIYYFMQLCKLGKPLCMSCGGLIQEQLRFTDILSLITIINTLQGVFITYLFYNG